MSQQQAVGVYAGKPETFGMFDVPRQRLSQGQVEVEVLTAGDCATSEAVRQGRYFRRIAGRPSDFIVLGHEAIGKVTRIDDHVQNVKEGGLYALRVRRTNPLAVDHFGRLGRVDLSAMEHYLEYGLVGADGYFRRHVVLPADMLVRLPTGTDTEAAVFLDLLACVHKGIREAHGIRAVKLNGAVFAPRSALVIGCGSAGLLATMVYRAQGLNVTVVDIHPEDSLKALRAKEIGAVYIRAPASTVLEDLRGTVAEVRDAFGPFDFLFEASGNPALACYWTTALGPIGIIVNFGISEACRPHADADFYDRSRFMMTHNVAMTCCINADLGDWTAAIRLLRPNSDWLKTLLSPRLTLNETETLRTAPLDPSTIKTLIVMDR